MNEPDFSKYTLALFKNNEMIYYINKSGLRPILECARKYIGTESNCILHDKVIGLAAARVIVHSGFILEVYTDVISEPAQELLEKNSIVVHKDLVVENILNNDKTGICPMEKKAMDYTSNEKFYEDLLKLFHL
ncbi:MAG: DUF1893 domain-containing protein [Nanoarchaeota archaeon]|nr:DUF1893 domain-containing protein [Nanoarchaeota archaeon]